MTPKWKMRTTLVAFALVGAALIWTWNRYELEWDHGVATELGVALIVAAILGFTIDGFLKTALAKDVFEATLGYILRP
jgi:hypothetical protein